MSPSGLAPYVLLSFQPWTVSAMALAVAVCSAAMMLRYRRRWIGSLNAVAAADQSRNILMESIDLTPASFALFSAQQEVIAGNAAFRALYGDLFTTHAGPVTFSDLARHSVGGTVPADQVEAEVAARAKRVFTEQGSSFERHYPDGRWMSFTNHRLRGGQVAGFGVDITSIRRREELVKTMIRNFEKGVEDLATSLTSASGRLEATAGGMADAAADANRRAITAAAAVEEASQSVLTVAGATEQLAASSVLINDEISQSAAKDSLADAAARHTDTIVQALARGAQSIGLIVGLISKITQQTKLLALNASIEAARAGEAGHGFAVVAAEVKVLAQQTAHATDEISGQIDDIQQATRQAVAAVQDISAIMQEVSASATNVAGAMAKQGEATAEIARTINLTSASTEIVSSNVAEVSKSADETRLAAADVLGAVSGLASQARDLAGRVNHFLEGVREA